MNYLLVTYQAAGVIAEAKAEITNSKQLEHMSAVRYSDVFWGKPYVVVVYMNKHI